jgi:non-canonical purine NTP pyrophosphatase (RdgB/HAM1 family)
MTHLTFVTQNPNKVADAVLLLPEFTIDHIDFDVPEVQSLDPHEVARAKIEYAYERTKIPCFVMDASLSLDALNGFPGPLVKWYFSNTVGAEKTCKIATLFGQRGCRWTTVLGYYDGANVTFLDESVDGTIPESPRGTNGFDWDVIFVPTGETRTFAEMTFEEKQGYAVTKKLLRRFHDLLLSHDAR